MTASDSSVCIIIAAFNSADTIERAIQSALVQPHVTEVVVVDDGSTDTTPNVARSLATADSRVRVIHMHHNQGPSAARNKGIEVSSSSWIGILDADDFFVGNRIGPMLEAKEENDFIADDLWQVEQDHPVLLQRTLLNNRITAPIHITLETFVAGNLSSAKQRGELGFIKPLMRRAFLTAHDLSYNVSMRLGEDYDLYARALACRARFVLLPPQGYVSIVRRNSLSGCHTETDLTNLRDANLSIAGIKGVTTKEHLALCRHYNSIDQRLQWRLVINAVKARDLAAFVRAYTTSLSVAMYVSMQLAVQLFTRARNILGMKP